MDTVAHRGPTRCLFATGLWDASAASGLDGLDGVTHGRLLPCRPATQSRVHVFLMSPLQRMVLEARGPASLHGHPMQSATLLKPQYVYSMYIVVGFDDALGLPTTAPRPALRCAASPMSCRTAGPRPHLSCMCVKEQGICAGMIRDISAGCFGHEGASRKDTWSAKVWLLYEPLGYATRPVDIIHRFLAADHSVPCTDRYLPIYLGT